MLEGEPRARVTLALSVTPGLICESWSAVGRLPRALILGLQAPSGMMMIAASTTVRRQSRRDMVPLGPNGILRAVRGLWLGLCHLAQSRVNLWEGAETSCIAQILRFR